ncbi:thiamine pyrophosphate enzyme, N-terminal TPP binding domain protein [Bordetella bronchiseptica SBL-F6116]|uniref:thiamine pyrophosphate-binding protein n=1 Tax=Bordetella bronchiseptica TaxID=518 RepID=UPI00045AD1F9|nr:thiamine pyrophosphate-binding protein [Bordetella bronchiseptica]KCV28236.1 thiamine pyrophosphate enzyme, N-terminal TPP binding domain protein [Bordetella bronchiseptica 00-P-2730]KDD99733.1 thiamine pyrophosphate enzyme, N-terminal TPP binding domain protein [Bordetella bronchiseptica SBL-F6116]
MLSLRPPAASGQHIVETFARCGIDSVTTVPDFIQLSAHARLDRDTERFLVTYCANENQALQVAMGQYIGGRRPVVLMQNQGLYNCVNALRACGLDANMPLLLVIGQFGREFANVGQDSRQSRRRMVSLLEPVLDALTIPYWTIEGDDDVPVIEQAWSSALRRMQPSAVIVGNYTLWD